MTVDRVLAIVGIVVGVPAFLALFVESVHRREAILALIIIALVIGFRMFVTYQSNKPQFEVLEVRKRFTIHDSAGTSAHFEGSRKMKANFKGVSEFWHRNIIQDGTISNIQIDGNAPDVTETVCGTTHLCKRFSWPLERGQVITTILSYDLTGSFCNPKHEGVIHNNPFKTDSVEMIVELPRPCIKAEFRRTYIGEEGELLPPPTLANGNKLISAQVKKPQVGASYHLEWDW
jgi:hypothetical protein